MKYVLLAYNDEGMLGAMPPGERATFGEACAANDEALRRSGRLLAAERFAGGDAATTVRVQNGRLAIGDGALATSAQLAGLFVIDARDLNEAIRIAAQMPQTRSGPLEVWPVKA
jgi:hypothetical protein